MIVLLTEIEMNAVWYHHKKDDDIRAEYALAAQRKFARRLKAQLIEGLTLGDYNEPERYTLLAKDLRELCQELGMEEP